MLHWWGAILGTLIFVVGATQVPILALCPPPILLEGLELVVESLIESMGWIHSPWVQWGRLVLEVLERMVRHWFGPLSSEMGSCGCI